MSTPRRHFSDAQRAVDPLLSEEDSNPLFREYADRAGLWIRLRRGVRQRPPASWDYSRLMKASWEAGMPARELVVFGYLASLRGAILPPILSLALVIAVASAPPLLISTSGLATLAVIGLAFASSRPLSRYWASVLLRNRVSILLAGNYYPTAVAHSFGNLAPSIHEVMRGMKPWHQAVLAVFAVLSMIAYWGFLLWLRAKGSHPFVLDAAVGSWGFLLLASSLLLEKRAAASVRRVRLQQVEWVAFAARMLELKLAKEDDPSPDTERWFTWFQDPGRDPAAQFPEVDTSEM